MSASTVSVSAHQGPITRRRAVEKNIPSGDFAAAAVITDSDARPPNAGDTAAAILRDARKTSSAQIQAKKSGAAKKTSKPRWLTVVSILTKNLALVVVLLGFVQMVRWTVMNSGGDVGDLSIMSGDFEGKLSEVEKSFTKTMKAMQVQINALDHKVEEDISLVRKEFDEKFGRKEAEVDLKLKALDVRSDAFEKFMDGFGSKSLLSKEEFSEFFEEFKKTRKGDKTEVNVDDIRKYAREVVLKEIEKHAADGLGMVDYALVSGGARVVKHSEPYGGKAGGSASWLLQRSRVSAEAERMIRPSFGEPGQCFALKGGSGFVEIRLRTAIVPEAVTLEHVAKVITVSSHI